MLRSSPYGAGRRAATRNSPRPLFARTFPFGRPASPTVCALASKRPNPSRPSTPERLAIAVLVLAVVVVYANSLTGVFVFDDTPGIVENPTLRHAGNIGGLIAPPGDEAGTVGGRPVLNLSLAFNYVLGGTQVVGYHVFNVAVHLAATLLLFGILRRTLKEREGGVAVAFAVALLWAVHPLQTEAVTYVIQRAESLMGLFYLLTLYGFIRLSSPEEASEQRGASPLVWGVLSVLACFLGMGTKEVMVSAPLVVLLYDRTFVAGSFHDAWCELAFSRCSCRQHAWPRWLGWLR
jgi:protein O-mannosyl-transferase